jgi:pyruvate dehydrogenase E2 component (dihydrolipoamide acetyltransferase)
MRHEVVMPRLSDAVEEGVLVTWFVELGAMVREGDLFAGVQVEKASAEVRAPVGGRVGELLFEPGGVVRQEAVIAVIESAEEVAAEPAPRGAAAEPSAVAAPRLPSAAVAAPAGPVAAPGPPAPVPLTAMRRTIADRLRTGLAATAQLTITAEADVTELAARLTEWSAAWGRRVSYTEVAVRACALALREHPRVAARLTEAGLVHPERLDIGVAVALDDGLIVPVVRDADRRSLQEIGSEIAGLAERARAGRLEPSETEGGCFSVTNLGGYRIDAFTPLLNPPQTAILGLGRARPRPTVVDGSIVARTLVVLSLTFDHQVVDGAPAAAFLDAVIGLLEAPDRLIG